VTFLLAALVVWIAGAFISLPVRRSKPAAWVGVATALGGGILATVQAVHSLWSAPAAWRCAWNVPFGEIILRVDPLSAVFLLPIGLLSTLAAVYGARYLESHMEGRHAGLVWWNFNILSASMVVVVTARHALLFLVAWEVMSLVSFLLVLFEHRHREVREAAWIYLVATHLGTAFLIVLFALMGRQAGGLDFDVFAAAAAAGLPAGVAGIWFILAVIGFGTKAGFMPMHVWLPEAHPASPSHVSAVLSGVMIKTGIYGLLRILTFLGPPPAWWGAVLVGVGMSSGVLGVLFALAQHDLKRLLAYHSVENIGIIAMGIGLGLLGVSMHTPILAVLGFAGALLHVVNHAVFKGLLFLGAGAVYHATGTRDIESLGGVLKRMPVTGVTFLIGAAAISGLPPLNGFISEFLIFIGAFHGILLPVGHVGLVFVGIVVALALIGGLAAACFAKAFGIVFLGEPRRNDVAAKHEAGAPMTGPMTVLAALCLAIGLLAPAVVSAVLPAAAGLAGLDLSAATMQAAPVMGWLAGIAFVALALLVLTAVIVLVRAMLLRGRRVDTAVTWDCGYAAPSPRMQYTASSFAQPLTSFFRYVLRQTTRGQPPRGLFPRHAAFETHSPDVMRETVYTPAFLWLRTVLGKMRRIQEGRLQLYVLYLVVTLLVLLAWQWWRGL
jgi:formate hydrogenlyase subunit 3/multisubunit Na+/H+ antiporter MnhD subunit